MMILIPVLMIIWAAHMITTDLAHWLDKIISRKINKAAENWLRHRERAINTRSTRHWN